MTVAMVTSIPFAYLYETGKDTIWAPALVHTAVDTFKLVIIPTAALATFSMLIIAVSLTVPLLALAVPRRLLQPSREGRIRNPIRRTDRGGSRISPGTASDLYFYLVAGAGFEPATSGL